MLIMASWDVFVETLEGGDYHIENAMCPTSVRESCLGLPLLLRWEPEEFGRLHHLGFDVLGFAVGEAPGHACRQCPFADLRSLSVENSNDCERFHGILR